MAAKATTGFVTVLRETVRDAGNEDECVGTDHLFLGDLSLAVYERETGLADTKQTKRENIGEN